MKLVVGLGNPGLSFLKTRHNAGFLFLDSLVDGFSIADCQNKFKGAWTEGEIAGTKLYFLKPMTFMNLSGQSVAAAAQFFKITPNDIWVFHDDLEVPLGGIKIKCGGSAKGHNGVRSIEQCLGSSEFWRVRIGIDRPPLKNQVHDYVLETFTEKDMDTLLALFERMVHRFPKLVEGHDDEYLKNIAQA